MRRPIILWCRSLRHRSSAPPRRRTRLRTWGSGRPAPLPASSRPGWSPPATIHSRLAISPDGREMFWTTVDTTTFSTRLLSVREVGGRWTEPQPPPFAREGSTQSPMFSPDGKRLYFRVRAEKGWSDGFVERLASGWSAPRTDGARLNCSSSFTRSGRVYFSSAMETKTWNTGIFSARLSPDGYSDIAPLDSAINVPNAIDYTPWVSPGRVLPALLVQPAARRREGGHARPRELPGRRRDVVVAPARVRHPGPVSLALARRPVPLLLRRRRQHLLGGRRDHRHVSGPPRTRAR